MTPRHALVTGGAGFIGSHVVAALRAGGAAVTVLDDLSMGRREAVPAAARFIHGDVRDEAAVRRALDGVDVVFHLAAQVTVRGSFARFYEDLDTNVMGTACLVRALDPSRVRWFTLASSMAVYADSPDGHPVAETHPTTPQSPYGVGKLAAEGVARQVLAMRGVPCTVLRYFNTFGPGQAYTPYVGVITIFLTRLLRGEVPVIFGDGEQQRDFVHVQDVAAATVAAVGRPPGTYNVGTGRGTSLTALARLAIDAAGVRGVSPRYEAAQPGELRHSVADVSAARRALGYHPERRLAEEMPRVVADVASRLASSRQA
ncbi:NDP-sugar dehydratase or epimerase [Luteitalea sp. TBR-22]|uniref:NAD-dependent epimerase/dehydratase family protein n=1 Tax=Luteitalea sp. TBR-22 TaxID=2802971 RepID=UPI001AFB809A|nr:NAD-dependent epimerase/dehydratase family protein [Luteitalea sp. TBR-22]BCS33280.1 NDP-sugar dehydratase or epimerase [Luteitalea sp. TBR-22]